MEASVFINHLIYNRHVVDNYDFDTDTNTFIGDELEYQIRDYSNGDLKSVLIRFVDDTSHNYIEVPWDDNDITQIDDFIDYVFSEDLVERLFYRIREAKHVRTAI